MVGATAGRLVSERFGFHGYTTQPTTRHASRAEPWDFTDLCEPLTQGNTGAQGARPVQASMASLCLDALVLCLQPSCIRMRCHSLLDVTRTEALHDVVTNFFFLNCMPLCLIMFTGMVLSNYTPFFPLTPFRY